jgi:hypothetical protein
MSISSKFVAGAVALSALGAMTLATPAAADGARSCFFVNQWQGWKADGPNILYLRVNLRDIYRVDLSAGAQQLMWAGSYHLVNRVQGSDSVCGPLDLQLAVSDGHGYFQPLIAKSMVKLTPEEAAALPPKLRP